MDSIEKERIMQTFKKDLYATVTSGVKLIDVDYGYAKTELTIEDKHLNAAGIGQGGAIFTLADYAFAVASNSHGKVALAINVDISYHLPARLGDILTAEAREIARSKRLATYIVSITNQEHRPVATFKGTVFIKDEELSI